MTKSSTEQTEPGTGKNGTQKPNGQSINFQARVDYVAKSLRRGTGGTKFKACLEQHDSSHIAAILMKRAERSDDLRSAIMVSFGVNTWNDVPWHETTKIFSGMSAQQIRMLADKTRNEIHAQFATLSRNTDLMLY